MQASLYWYSCPMWIGYTHTHIYIIRYIILKNICVCVLHPATQDYDEAHPPVKTVRSVRIWNQKKEISSDNKARHLTPDPVPIFASCQGWICVSCFVQTWDIKGSFCLIVHGLRDWYLGWTYPSNEPRRWGSTDKNKFWETWNFSEEEEELALEIWQNKYWWGIHRQSHKGHPKRVVSGCWVQAIECLRWQGARIQQ